MKTKKKVVAIGFIAILTFSMLGTVGIPQTSGQILSPGRYGIQWVADFSTPSLYSWNGYDENGNYLTPSRIVDILGEENSGRYIQFEQAISVDRFLIHKRDVYPTFTAEFFTIITDRYENGYPGFVFRWNGINDYYWVEFSANDVRLVRGDGTPGGVGLATSDPYSFYTNQWHQVIIQHTTTTIKVTVNGIELVDYRGLPSQTTNMPIGFKSYKGKAHFANIVVADDLYGLVIGRSITWLDKAYRDVSPTEAVIKDHPGIPFKINIGGSCAGNTCIGGEWFFPGYTERAESWDIEVLPEYQGYVYDYRFTYENTDVTTRISYIENDRYAMRVSLQLQSYQSDELLHFFMGEKLGWIGENYQNFTWIQPGGYFSNTYSARHGTQLAAWIYKELQHIDTFGANGWTNKATKLQNFMSNYDFNYDVYAPMFEADIDYSDDWTHLTETWPDADIYSSLPLGQFGYAYKSRLALKIPILGDVLRQVWILKTFPFDIPDGLITIVPYYDSLKALHLINKYGVQDPYEVEIVGRLIDNYWDGTGTRLWYTVPESTGPILNYILHTLGGNDISLLRYWSAYPMYLTAPYAAAAAKYASLSGDRRFERDAREAIKIILQAQWRWRMPEQRGDEIFYVNKPDAFGGFLAGYESGSMLAKSLPPGTITGMVDWAFSKLGIASRDPSDKHLSHTSAESTTVALQALILYRTLYPDDAVSIGMQAVESVISEFGFDSVYGQGVYRADTSGNFLVWANSLSPSIAGGLIDLKAERPIRDPVIIVSGFLNGNLTAETGGYAQLSARVKIVKSGQEVGVKELVIARQEYQGTTTIRDKAFSLHFPFMDLMIQKGARYDIQVEILANAFNGITDFYTRGFTRDERFEVWVTSVDVRGLEVDVQVLPSFVQLLPGETTTLLVRASSNIPHPVILSVRGLPRGVTGTFETTQTTTPFETNLTLTASSTAMQGTFDITVKARGSRIREDMFTLLVGKAPTIFDYNMTFSPASVIIAPGESGQTNLNLNLTSGTGEIVDLQVLSAADALTVTLGAERVVVPSTVPVTIDVSLGAVLDTYEVTIRGTSQDTGVIREATLTVIILPPEIPLEEWTPATVPLGHFVHFSQISTPYETTGWEVDTIGSPDYPYDFFAYSEPITTSGSGTLNVTGYFKMNDIFWSSLRPGRSLMQVYVVSQDVTTIIQRQNVLDWNDVRGTWYYRTASFVDLPPGETVRIAIGRPDHWSYDWKLYAAWTQVKAAVVTPFNFQLSIDPADVVLPPGGASTNTTVRVKWTGGMTPELVSLSASGVPAGTTITFTPSSGYPAFTSRMDIVTGPSTPQGVYPITVTGIGGGITRQAVFTLSVLEQATVVIRIESTIVTDYYDRYHGRTIDEPLDQLFWITQPESVIGIGGVTFSFSEVITLSTNMTHTYEYGISAFVGYWHTKIWANNTLIAEGDVDLYNHLIAYIDLSEIHSQGTPTNPLIAAHFEPSLSLEEVTVTTSDLPTTVSADLTLEWTHGESPLPLFINITAPTSITYTITELEPSSGVNATQTTSYTLTFDLPADLQAKTYPIHIAVTEEPSGQQDKVTKSVVFKVRVEEG